MVTLVSAPGLAVFLVARSSFFTWATASIKPLNKRAPNRIRFISDVVPCSGEYTTRAARGGFAKSRENVGTGETFPDLLSCGSRKSRERDDWGTQPFE